MIAKAILIGYLIEPVSIAKAILQARAVASSLSESSVIAISESRARDMSGNSRVQIGILRQLASQAEI